MDEKIIAFLEATTCASISCLDENGAIYSFNSFISFDKNSQSCYFKSSSNSTTHGKLLKENPQVSGTILPDTLEVNAIKGIQFKGAVKMNSIFDVSQAMHYHTKYPMAMAVPGDMWTLQFHWIKYTDNTLGFGTKIEWEKD